MKMEQYKQCCWVLRCMAQYHVNQCISTKSNNNKKYLQKYAVHLNAAIHCFRAIVELLYPDAYFESDTQKQEELYAGAPCTIEDILNYCGDVLAELYGDPAMTEQFIKLMDIQEFIETASHFVEKYEDAEKRCKREQKQTI